MKWFECTYKPYGNRAILVTWDAIIDDGILKDVLRFKRNIESYNIKSIIEIKYAYNSLLIIYDSFCRNYENEVEFLKSCYVSEDFKHDIVSRLWKIPVCYDAQFGIDLEAISVEKKLSNNAIISLHSQAIYTVYFIGFLPGFLYLGGLDETLFTPRKATPRLHIEKGSVAIGGNQTGVYPSASPGGWNVIGNSPINFFNPTLETPCFAKPLDKIQFVPVLFSDYQDIKTLVQSEVYQIESEVWHG